MHQGIITPARRYATVKSAADYIGSSDKTVRRLAAQGKITLYRHGQRLVRVDLNQLDALLTPGSPGAGGGPDAA